MTEKEIEDLRARAWSFRGFGPPNNAQKVAEETRNRELHEYYIDPDGNVWYETETRGEKMDSKIKKLIEEYVEADRNYKLELDKEFPEFNKFEMYKETREDIARYITDILAEKEGYFRTSTKELNLNFWVKPGEDPKAYENIYLEECYVNHFDNGRTVVINNGKITNIA